MKAYIKEQAARLGADLCEVAAVDRFVDAPAGFHPLDIYADCKSVIVVAVAMPKGLMNVAPRLIYGHGNDLCKQRVDMCAHVLALAIEARGGIAVPLPADGPYDAWDAQTLTGKGLLSMKHAAVLAGLGFLGKSTVFINEKYGTLLNIGAILTDVKLASDDMVPSGCLPGCSKCIRSCPAQALDGVTVDQGKCRPHTYGKNARGFETVSCNACRMACPLVFGVRA